MSWLATIALVGLLGLIACTAGYAVVKDTLPLAARTAFERLEQSPVPYIIAVACFGTLLVTFLVSRQWLGVANALLGTAWSAGLYWRRPKSPTTFTQAEPRA